ncbi:MAG TPA: glycosyltransferase family 2 protein [Kiritimatiellia bacterium]|nr:glycosyltransferase family 2 protein [Kiritimatiellia bacterium]
MAGDRLPLSVVVLCRNEEANLPGCLDALQGRVDVVVVDDGSSDESRTVARAHGARVVEHRFTSFADQRNWAMEEGGLRNEWALHLDADEVVTEAGLRELAEMLPRLSPGQVGWVVRKVMLEGRWLRYSADYPVYVPRLVHRSGPRFVMRGHGETVMNEEQGGFLLKEPLLHHSFSKGWEEWRDRHRGYARAEARRLSEGGAGWSWRGLVSKDATLRRQALRGLSFRLPGRPALRFVYGFIVRGGWRDGRQGLRFCREMAGYEAMIDEALTEQRRGDEGRARDSRS